MPDHPQPPLLQMRDIHARYGPHDALKGVDFDLSAGEIHGLVGEHRAGKSTLIKVIGGAIPKTQGSILLNGKPFQALSPKMAIQQRIGIMYQVVNVPASLNAVEYVFAGRELTHWYGTLDQPRMIRETEALFARLNVRIPLDVPLALLPEAKQLMVELARVLASDPEIIIFDEISGRLTPQEMETIYTLLADLKQHGKSVIYISHNLDEIFKFADRVTILRNGYRVGTEEVRELDKVKLMRLTYSFMLSREELENENRELYWLKKYNETIIKNLPEGVIILDSHHQISIANDAAIRILELGHIDARQQPIAQILHPDALVEAPEILSQIQRREPHTWDAVAYGCERILKIHVFPFEDDDYQFQGTILLIEDVSKETYFNEYLSRTEKIASVAELAAGVAHEINNPLGIIQNYVAILKDRHTEPDDCEKLTKIEKELRRIVEIIETLLSFSRPKKTPLARLNLVTVLDETILLLTHKFKEKQVALTWSKPPQDALVLGEENRLKQVFINLIINSIEAVAAHGVIEIALDVRPQDGYVEVSITDNGAGIPEEVRGKIFDPFFTTKAGKKNAGLGLSICQHIIEAHHGLITCSSCLTTTFSVKLPMLKT